MLWSASGLNGYAIEASDGAIGSVADFLFDDQGWQIRWIVIDTGAWLPGRKVLLPPSQLGVPDAADQTLAIAMTRAQIEGGPDIARDPPVSRQQEELIYRYYGWAPYWGAAPVGAGDIGFPPIGPPMQEQIAAAGMPPLETDGDPHLRAVSDVGSYYITARDGDIGHVEDLLLDSSGWTIRYLIVGTRNWWPGKKVVIAPQWAADISWSEQSVQLDLTREQIQNSPEYDPAMTVERAYEERLHSHYQRPGYWF